MTSILWLARDFRFHDNEALRAAVAQGPVLPVFVVDRLVQGLGAAARLRLQAALRAFDAAWLARTGQRLTVLQGEAADLLPALAQDIGATAIHQNDWPWVEQRRVQAALSAALRGQACQLRLHQGHLLIAPQKVTAAKGSAYRVYTPFARALRRLGPDAPCPDVTQIAALPSRGLLDAVPPFAPDLHRGASVLAAHMLPVGETQALQRLDDFLDHAQPYPDLRDHAAEDVGSNLSEHLALGEISPRLIWARASLHAQLHPAQAAGIDKFLSEVIWREFAWHMLIDFPDLAQRPWKSEWQDFPWRGENPDLQAWQQARTGVPLVDAGLREMWVTGRMHNRVRMVVASWLTKHLLTDWRLGLAHFADCLTDWDPASNAMNWQWVAGCGPDASPFFRIFNPVKQAAQYDAAARYRQRWLAGYQGGTAPEADAYVQAVPLSWDIPTPYRDSADDIRLALGRSRALEALSAHKQRPSPMRTE